SHFPKSPKQTHVQALFSPSPTTTSAAHLPTPQSLIHTIKSPSSTVESQAKELKRLKDQGEGLEVGDLLLVFNLMAHL
ncbi:hypothetical protein PJP10_32705, partial [Mycobacterium kansasii]